MKLPLGAGGTGCIEKLTVVNIIGKGQTEILYVDNICTDKVHLPLLEALLEAEVSNDLFGSLSRIFYLFDF